MWDAEHGFEFFATIGACGFEVGLPVGGGLIEVLGDAAEFEGGAEGSTDKGLGELGPVGGSDALWGVVFLQVVGVMAELGEVGFFHAEMFAAQAGVFPVGGVVVAGPVAVADDAWAVPLAEVLTEAVLSGVVEFRSYDFGLGRWRRFPKVFLVAVRTLVPFFELAEVA